MTFDQNQEVKCGFCGHTAPKTVLANSSWLGSPDLDLRLPEPARSSLAHYVVRCQACGYCAFDLGVEPSSWARDAVASDRYRRQLADESYPELARAFLCSAMAHSAAGEDARAGWATMGAAWVCDDLGSEMSGYCRHVAAHYFHEAQEFDEPFASDRGSEHAILADLFRRSRQYADAEKEIEEGLNATNDETTRVVLSFIRELMDRDDDGAHTVAEAVEWASRRRPTA